MNYERINWENAPSTDTPLDADNLNKMDEALDTLNREVAKTRSDVQEVEETAASLGSQIAGIIRLEDGSTTGDAELINGRVGKDGTTYPVIGDAIRGQIGDLRDHVIEVSDEEPEEFYNKIWVKDDAQEIEIPTKAELDAVDAAVDELNERLDDEITDVKTAIHSLGLHTLSQNIPANTGTNIAFKIIKGQTYLITIDLVNPLASASIRTKNTAADSTFIETLYAGAATTNALVTATEDANYLFFVSSSEADMEIKLLSSKYAYDKAEADNNVLYNKLFADIEMYGEMHKGYTIATNQGVGNTVNPNNLTVNNQGACGVFPVAKNDSFIISGTGGSTPRLWCFTDSEYKILMVANGGVNVSDLSLIAPVAGYLIVNFFGILNPDQSHSIVKVNSLDEIEYLNETTESLIENIPFAGIDMFRTVACLGDSFTQGGMRNRTNTKWVTALKTYPKVIAGRHGIVATNYGYGGSTAKSYITDELPAVLSAPINDLYIMSWGLNDAYNGLTIGTIADINDSDYTQNADSFYGNLGKIVAMLKEAFPLARFVIFGPWIVGGIYEPYNKAAEAVASHFNIGYCNIEDDAFFTSPLWTDTMIGNHPTQVTYSGMAYAIERLLSKEIEHNNSYYRFAGLEEA